MRPYFSFPFVIMAAVGLFLLLGLIFILVQVGLVTVAFAKLGMSPGQALLWLLFTLIGSGVNLPLYKTSRLVRRPVLRGQFYQFGTGAPLRMETETELTDQVVAVNVGGCVIPCLLSLYFLSNIGLEAGTLLAVAATGALCYALARPIPGKGIGIPVLLPPLGAALAALLMAPPEVSPQVAYIAGSIGTLLGADVLHLVTPKTKALLDAPMLSIGGAGTFDGIFLTGIIAVLLA
ncbi:DUF1614 domain-containing protein [Desulfovibrio ferrophilus]|uniref:DUF1614 domain-containing protein n=1 Tax=Desulfovibrio ferrophilus TaxID=241368 RepID=A0A2Z6B2Q7_9BACT|nr:DUF1614 domain-containing protein [Desulfovibrio ferrophilus]BBD09771.1 uncharacterized protein DFE_3045 [Desulfovibrio ferrophilus]